MSLQIVINYNDANDFTYDGTVITIASSAQLTNLRPANSTFYVGFRIPASFAGMYGNGVLTGTNNGASLGTNILNLTGGTLKYVDYAAQSNANSAQAGCVRVQVKPNYSGTPGTLQCFWVITDSDNVVNDLIEFYHRNTGDLEAAFFDQSGTLIAAIVFGAFSPVAGTTYEMELNYNLTSGATRLFVDGVQLGATNTATGTRNAAAINLLRLGTDYSATYTANFSLSNFIVFSTVQHTSNFTSELPRAPETEYDVSNPSILVNSIQGMTELNSFIETAVKPANTIVQYQMVVDGQAKYWDGASWVDSDGTLTQSNTASVINTNAATLLSAGAGVQVNAILSSTYGTATPTLTSVEEDFEFFAPAPEKPAQCFLYAYLEDIIGNTDITDAKLIVELAESTVLDGWVVGASKYLVDFDANGYGQISLVATLEYEVSFTYTDSAGVERTIVFNPATIPEEVSVSLVDVTTIQSG